MRIEHRRWKITGLLAFAATCLGIFMWLFVAAGGHLRLHQPYTARVHVPTAFQLVKNGDVRRAGVKIGTVQDITNRGDTGLVTIELKKGFDPLYKDAVARVRTKTLVGENYLDLTPGSPRAGKLPDGGTLPLEQAGEAVQLDQILSSLDKRTRADVQRNLDTLGPGVKGRGEAINRLWAASRPTARDGGTVARILAGQKREVAALVANTGEVMQAFGDRQQQIRTLARQAKTTAIAAQSRDRELGAAFRALGPALTQARQSSATLASFSGRATPVMSRLANVTHDLRPVLADLRPAARVTRQLFGELPSALKAANPVLLQLKPFSGRLAPAVTALDAFLRQGGPMVDYLAPYYRDLGSVFANNGSVFSTKDAVGHRGRVHGMYSYSSLTAFSPETRKVIQSLMSFGGASITDGEGTNSYPKPGSVGDPKPFSGDVARIQAAK